MSIPCPKCNEQKTSRLSLVYESGISDVNTKTGGGGIGFGRGGIGIAIGSSTTKGVAQTALSQRAAPPRKSSYLKILKYWFFTTLGLEIIMPLYHVPNSVQPVVIYGALFGAFYAFYRAFMFNKNTWPLSYERWSNSYLCTCCSCIFEDNSLSHQPALADVTPLLEKE